MDKGTVVPVLLFLCVTYGVTYVIKLLVDARVRIKMLQASESKELIESVIRGDDHRGRMSALRWGLLLLLGRARIRDHSMGRLDRHYTRRTRRTALRIWIEQPHLFLRRATHHTLVARLLPGVFAGLFPALLSQATTVACRHAAGGFLRSFSGERHASATDNHGFVVHSMSCDGAIGPSLQTL